MKGHIFGFDRSMRERRGAKRLLVTAIGVVALAGGLLPVSPAIAARSGCTDQIGGNNFASVCSFTSRTDAVKYKASNVGGLFDLSFTIWEYSGACPARGSALNTYNLSGVGSGTEPLSGAGDCVVVQLFGSHGKITVSST